MSATQTTEQAMDVLRVHRARLITIGRYLAAYLARTRGRVNSRMLREAMAERGHLPRTAGPAEFWLGAIFNDKGLWEWTGEYHDYSDPERNIHQRTVKWWRLKAGADLPLRPDMPTDQIPLWPRADMPLFAMPPEVALRETKPEPGPIEVK